MYITSQVLVVLSDIFCIFSMMSKKKISIVLFLLLSTVFFATHYLFLKGWTGAAIGFIELVYLGVLYLLESKNKTQYNMHLSFATIIITLFFSIITWGTWISVFPMTAMIVYLVGLMFKNVIIVKSGTFIRLTLNGIYMLLLKSYFGAVLTIVILIFTIVGIVNDHKNKKEVEIKLDKDENF